MNNSNNKQPLFASDEKTIGSLLDCAKRGENRGKQRPPSICKVSRILRDVNESSFEPQLVSIGPIHREDPKLQEFEWQKECYLNDLLGRCDSMPKETVLQAWLLKVNDLIPQIRESYAGMMIQEDQDYSDDKLAMMMVMDGCFILEFCLKHKKENVHLPNKMQNTRIAMDLILLENQVPFFVLQGLFDCLAPYISKKNLTLNQVLDTYLAPYIKLFRSDLLPEKISTTDLESGSTDDHVDSDSTRVLLSKGEDSEVGEHSAQQANMPGHVYSDSTHDHILGYLYKLYHLEAAKSPDPKHAEASKLVVEEQAVKQWRIQDLYKGVCTCIPCVYARSAPAVKSPDPKHAEASKLVVEEQAAKSSNRKKDAAFHSIVELDRSGMNFKSHQHEDEWSMTIEYFEPSNFPCLPFFLSKCLLFFWSNPALLMPTLVIDDTTELILRNFIAYEQSFPTGRYYFTSYARAMDKLIDSKEDIAKLVESKVLVNSLGSNQDAADMINNICKNVHFTDFYYTDEFERVDTYYNGIWPNTIAWLRRVYFSNPWSAIALVAAIILFGLTVVQTIYTIRAA